MPTGAGDFDANGIWFFGEDDNEGLFSDTLNLLSDSVSDSVATIDGRLTDVESKDTVWVRAAANTSTNTAVSALSFDTNPVGAAFTHAAGVFTCQTTGLYRIMLTITYGTSATGSRGWRLVGSGSLGTRTKQTASISGTTELTDQIQWVVAVSATDTITAQSQQNSGGNLSTSAEILFTRLD